MSKLLAETGRLFGQGECDPIGISVVEILIGRLPCACIVKIFKVIAQLKKLPQKVTQLKSFLGLLTGQEAAETKAQKTPSFLFSYRAPITHGDIAAVP